MDETERARAYARALFSNNEPEHEPAPEAPQEPITGPVIHGQERMPDKVTENPLRTYTRALFDASVYEQ
ncbi:hypothetical protein [Arthrobacter sp. Br18]|uniref:hypothetical protein n=1 Tax=Arthrobacter sp. Br18 TaxID=1312954 RepID=UPI00047A64F8|nr:hypothetical protein [Arthrobacter sp. Br18]